MVTDAPFNDPFNALLNDLFEDVRGLAEKLADAFDSSTQGDSKQKNSAQGNNALKAVEGSPSLVNELVATMLSQNTSDVNSSRAFAQLKAAFPTWQTVIAATERELVEPIRIGGLAEQKAARIQAVLRAIADRATDTNGEPTLSFLATMTNAEAMQYLCAFKGVGVKTAACVLMFGLQRELCAVDTHIHRILNRTGCVHTRTADETFAAIQPAFDEERQRLANDYPHGLARSLHVNLIRLGKTVCMARVPHCASCPLAEECAFARMRR